MVEFFFVFFFVILFEEFYIFLVLKYDDVKGDEDVKESNEELVSIFDFVNDVYDVNGEGLMEFSIV